jgi:hypothetical protein
MVLGVSVAVVGLLVYREIEDALRDWPCDMTGVC